MKIVLTTIGIGLFTTFAMANYVVFIDKEPNFIIADQEMFSNQVKIQASDREKDANFGWSVSINGDKAVVGAKGVDTGGSNAGAAYIYQYNGTTWTEEAKIQASDKETSDYFGTSVSIDGDTVIVSAIYEDTGAINAGAAYIFD